MVNTSHLSRRQRTGYGFAFVLGLVMVAGGSRHAPLGGAVFAQTPNPCALVTPDDIKALASNATVGAGVASTFQTYGAGSCRYTWGVGTDRFTVSVVVNDAARMFPGMTPDQIKQRLVGSVVAGTADAVISEVGDTAVFKADSPFYSTAMAVLKGRVVEVQLDGFVAQERKDQAIALLKSAASRL